MSRSLSRRVLRARRRERWSAWIAPVLAVALVAALLCLAAANVVVRANWNELVDGVLWVDRPAGVTAVEVAPEEAGERAGIAAGDLLLALDGVPVQSTRDVVEHLHARQLDGHVAYTLLRRDESRLIDVTLQPAPAAQTQMYFVLVAIGVFTLLVGASVRLRRPGTQATLHFFWLSVAFFGMFAFSFSGRLDRLDWVFYWPTPSRPWCSPPCSCTSPWCSRSGRPVRFGTGWDPSSCRSSAPPPSSWGSCRRWRWPAMPARRCSRPSSNRSGSWRSRIWPSASSAGWP